MTPSPLARATRGLLCGLLLAVGQSPLAATAAAAQLVMFEEPGCPWCAAWDREIGVVYHKTEEGRRAPLRRVDMTAPRPADLVGIETIVYSPTFVLMERGREVGRIVGYPGEHFFWPLLAELLERLEERPEDQQM